MSCNRKAAAVITNMTFAIDKALVDVPFSRRVCLIRLTQLADALLKGFNHETAEKQFSFLISCSLVSHCKKITLEIIEGAMKNGQSKETGSIAQNKGKQSKKPHITEN